MSREKVKEVCKMGSFQVETKDGPYTLNLALWLAELGVNGRASGKGNGFFSGTSYCMGGAGRSPRKCCGQWEN